MRRKDLAVGKAVAYKPRQFGGADAVVILAVEPWVEVMEYVKIGDGFPRRERVRRPAKEGESRGGVAVAIGPYITDSPEKMAEQMRGVGYEGQARDWGAAIVPLNQLLDIDPVEMARETVEADRRRKAQRDEQDALEKRNRERLAALVEKVKAFDPDAESVLYVDGYPQDPNVGGVSLTLLEMLVAAALQEVDA